MSPDNRSGADSGAGTKIDVRRVKAGRDVNVSVRQTIYHAPPPQTQAIDLGEAEQRLAALPLDEVPPVRALPPGSRMAYAPNPLFTGRAHDLRALARNLTQPVLGGVWRRLKRLREGNN